MLPAVNMFLNQVVAPANRTLGLDSHVANMLVLGTAAQESQFKYLEQLSGGPGIGLFQMETATHDDLWRNWLRHRRLWRDRAYVWSATEAPALPDASEMAWNLRYAATMTRLHYYRVKEPLPLTADPWALAAYYKTHYNTIHGKATLQQFVSNFNRYVLGAP